MFTRPFETESEKPLVYMPAAFPDGYLELGSPAELESLHSDLRKALHSLKCFEVKYNRDTIAYGIGNSIPEHEPVVLHRWRGNLSGSITPVFEESDRCDFDTIGLQIIINGRGRIQGVIHDDFLASDTPDSNSTKDRMLYTFGCKQKGYIRRGITVYES